MIIPIFPEVDSCDKFFCSPIMTAKETDPTSRPTTTPKPPASVCDRPAETLGNLRNWDSWSAGAGAHQPHTKLWQKAAMNRIRPKSGQIRSTFNLSFRRSVESLSFSDLMSINGLGQNPAMSGHGFRLHVSVSE